MREIKFRIWDNKYLTFDYSASPDLFISTDGEVFEKDTVNFAMQTYDEYNKADYYKISQFTGLKDKNGKEIYEGDVIEFYVGTWKTVVEFKDGSFICYVPRERGTVVTEEILFNVADRCEIIGNIYENPELLESGQHE